MRSAKRVLRVRNHVHLRFDLRVKARNNIGKAELGDMQVHHPIPLIRYVQIGYGAVVSFDGEQNRKEQGKLIKEVGYGHAVHNVEAKVIELKHHSRLLAGKQCISSAEHPRLKALDI